MGILCLCCCINGFVLLLSWQVLDDEQETMLATRPVPLIISWMNRLVGTGLVMGGATLVTLVCHSYPGQEQTL